MNHRIEGTLGASLKKLRLAAGITQEELAERAGISARTVSDVERGLRTVVHRDTARRLATALELGDEQRREFDAVARGRSAIPLPAASTGDLPTVPTPLIGRSREVEAIGTVLRAADVRLLTLNDPATQALVIAGQERLLSALRAGDGEAAAEAMRAHDLAARRSIEALFRTASLEQPSEAAVRKTANGHSSRR